MPADWSPDRIALLRTLWADATLSATEIGRRMGINKNQVVGKVHHLGLPNRPPGNTGAPVEQARLDAVAADVRDGLTAPRIAASRGLTVGQVTYIVRKLGLSTDRAAKAQANARKRTAPRPVQPLAKAMRAPLRRAAAAAALLPPARTPLSAGACRWPLWGDERPTQRFCTEPRRDPLCPYCPAHAAIAFTGASAPNAA